MSPNASSSLLIMKQKLSLSTPFFGIPLWILLLASTAAFIVVACVIMCVCFIYCTRQKSSKPRLALPKSIACKRYHNSNWKLLSASGHFSELDMNIDKLLKFCPQANNITNDGYLKGLVRRGCNFSLKEIEDATNGLAGENVVGSGDNGIVYLGLLTDNKKVAVKRLVCDSGQLEEYFASQMEAIGHVKHNNLVKLLGYCTEGAYRMSVSEYVDNGNLHYWLHEFPGKVSPLTWTIRSNIIHDVAKGLAYLHEENKPKILHGSIKSSNILLDQNWNPKISDYGLAKLLCHESSHIITESLGHVSTSTLTEGSDIYGFGVLIMEIISGRVPVRHSQPQGSIVDWFKSMISSGKISYVVDQKLPEMPSSKELKRCILVALRCVDPDVNPRIKMVDVIGMLEKNFLVFDEHKIAMALSSVQKVSRIR